MPRLSHLESRKLELKEFGPIEPVTHVEFRLSVAVNAVHGLRRYLGCKRLARVSRISL